MNTMRLLKDSFLVSGMQKRFKSIKLVLILLFSYLVSVKLQSYSWLCFRLTILQHQCPYYKTTPSPVFTYFYKYSQSFASPTSLPLQEALFVKFCTVVCGTATVRVSCITLYLSALFLPPTWTAHSTWLLSSLCPSH